MKTPPPPEGNILVLIVDDDPTVRLIARDVLALAGFRTEAAENGDEALAAIPSLQPDLILLDVSMPGTDGFTVCRTLRQSGSPIPVVMMTGWVDQDTIRRIHETGATDYLEKPFDWKTLGDRLRSVILATISKQDPPPETS